MATDDRRTLSRDEQGAALLEFTVVSGVFLSVLFGVVEFAHVYHQWNAATKATQVGARLAAVSSPVWEGITQLNGTENGGLPGDDLTIAGGYDYSVTCSGATASCTITRDTINGSQATNYDSAAMSTLVFGRGSAACSDDPGTYFGMCDMYNRVEPENVRVTYTHTDTGYATRPGGLVPTITLELIGLNFEFVFLDDLLGLGPVQIPGLTTTMIAEDMNTDAPSFGGTPTGGGNGGGNNGGGNNGGGNNGGGNNGGGNGNGNGGGNNGGGTG